MEEPNLYLARITDDNILHVPADAVIAGSVLRGRVQFTFPASWDGLVKTAVFCGGGKTVSVALNDETNPMHAGADICYIPAEVIASGGIAISVCGTQGAQRATSTVGVLRVLASGYAEGSAPADPTPDVYTRITAQLAGHIGDADAHVSDEDRARWDEGGGSTVPIASTLDSKSTNKEAAGAKAVYDAGVAMQQAMQAGIDAINAKLAADPLRKLSGAQVGQLIKVSAVDASGKPTAWVPVDLPDALKNPNALTFTGAVTGAYDGSAAKNVNIPTVPPSLKNPYALTIKICGTTVTYDGSLAKTVEIADGTEGSY